MTAVGIFLRQDSDVGDENETRIFGRLNRFFVNGVPTTRSQEKQTALTPAVRRLAQVFGEIERRIVGFPLVLERNSLVFERNSRNVFLVEQVGDLESGMLEVSFGLADEVIDLRCSNARNFVFNRAESAGTDR